MYQRPLDDDPVGQAMVFQQPRPGTGCLDLLAEPVALGTGEFSAERLDAVGGQSFPFSASEQILATDHALLQAVDEVFFLRADGSQSLAVGGHQQLAFLGQGCQQFVLDGQQVVQ